MSLFSITLAIHVVAAILGLGQVAGLAVASSPPSGGTTVAPHLHAMLLRFTRSTALALAVLLGSGIVLEVVSGGSFHGAWWFRLSFFLLFALGALNGRTRRLVRKLDPGSGAEALRPVATMARAMCAVVFVIAFLMAAKPF